MLHRYNVLPDKHVKEPVRVVAVNASIPEASAAAAAAAAAEREVGAPSSGIEAEVLDTVPKTMQSKARRLVEHLKRNIARTARC